MKTDSLSSAKRHLLSPASWLAVVLISALLAAGSAWVLASRSQGQLFDVPGQAFDSIERFLFDTIRLSFKARMKGGLSEDVFVAPRGLLDQNATFNWLENSQDIEVRQTEPPIRQAAPLRLLDPQWQPDFSGLPK